MISFDDEVRLTKALLDLMKNEQESLIAADIDAISEVIDQKALLIKEIGQASAIRYQALKAIGFQPSERGMADWLLQQTPKIRAVWQAFHEVIEEAKETNRINGMLITKHFSINQQKLNVFVNTGQKNSQLYGRNGQTYTSQYKPGLQV